jgi:hypothetical protein
MRVEISLAEIGANAIKGGKGIEKELSKKTNRR